MMWLKHCVDYVQGGLNRQYSMLLTIAALDRFQGLQAPVILASLVSEGLACRIHWDGGMGGKPSHDIRFLRSPPPQRPRPFP